MESKNSNIALGIVLVMLLLGGMVLLARRPIQAAPIFRQSGGEVKKFQITEQEPEGRRYINTKEWNITYNEDGLPTKIVKHVDAVVT